MGTEQAWEALALANERRMYRAQLRATIKAAPTLAVQRSLIVEALVDPQIKNLPVAVLLGYQNRWGPARVGRLMEKLGITETTVGRLSLRQRGQLAIALGCSDRVDRTGAWIPRPGEPDPDPLGRLL